MDSYSGAVPLPKLGKAKGEVGVDLRQILACAAKISDPSEMTTKEPHLSINHGI